MEQDRIWVLMARRLAGEITSQEQAELEQLVRNNPEVHFPIQTITELWNPETYDTDPDEPDPETHAAYLAHVERLRTAHASNTKSERRNLLPYIITLVAVLVITYLLMPGDKDTGKAHSLRQITTKSGSKTKSILPDGSQVWVNANSSLTYDDNFGKKNRELSLTGEAYFIVTPDSLKPFTIHTSNMVLTARGTSFNVKSYPGEQTSEAALISGNMEILLTAQEQRKINLRAGEKLVVSGNHHSSPPDSIAGKSVDEPLFLIKNITHFNSADSLIVETSWVYDKLVFTYQPLREIALQMERLYGVSIKLSDSQTASQRYTGILQKTNVRDALTVLAAIEPFDFSVSGDGRTVYVKSKSRNQKDADE